MEAQDYTNNNKLQFYIFFSYGPTAFGPLSSAFVTSPSKECYDLGGVVLFSPGPGTSLARDTHLADFYKTQLIAGR
ncbi:hypothetical protein PR002_g5088 [Phytophthora rubi]|uniref:Uncharacterized protein n=1 Tax=Phytophthora rubi TaxID=129364 RepID=A0A6A3N3W1_9STRA|nr:hypothetical protein PR002_g5088 [Phytophthora rubi]